MTFEMIETTETIEDQRYHDFKVNLKKYKQQLEWNNWYKFGYPDLYLGSCFYKTSNELEASISILGKLTQRKERKILEARQFILEQVELSFGEAIKELKIKIYTKDDKERSVITEETFELGK